MAAIICVIVAHGLTRWLSIISSELLPSPSPRLTREPKLGAPWQSTDILVVLAKDAMAGRRAVSCSVPGDRQGHHMSYAVHLSMVSVLMSSSGNDMSVIMVIATK